MCVALVVAMVTSAPTALQIALVYLTVAAAVAADNRRPTHRIVRAMSGISQMTYSIYMWHLIFVTFFLAALRERVFGGSLWAVLPLAVGCWAAVTAWSYVSFVWIETPARRWLNHSPT